MGWVVDVDKGEREEGSLKLAAVAGGAKWRASTASRMRMHRACIFKKVRLLIIGRRNNWYLAESLFDDMTAGEADI